MCYIGTFYYVVGGQILSNEINLTNGRPSLKLEAPLIHQIPPNTQVEVRAG